jgi:phosphatidylserine synthase
MVILYQHITEDPAKETLLFVTGRWMIIHFMAFVTITLAALMVSRIRYPHLVNQYLRGKKPITHLVWTVVLLGMIYLCSLQMAMVILFGGFAASGLVRWIWFHTPLGKALGHKIHAPATGDSHVLGTEQHVK